MKLTYRHTIYACYIGYITQAIVNNFAPLLFLTFQSQYGIPLYKITALITLNFGLQLAVDFASVFFIDRIGYRNAAVAAHVFAAAGLVGLAVLPSLLPDPYVGLLLSVVLYALGGGLLEVIVSPIAEACPFDRKAQVMSLLHSFYCWGCVGIMVLSTLFFTVIGIGNWKILAFVWALVPAFNCLFFATVPIAPLIAEGEKGLSLGQLLRSKLFWLFMLLMVCSGASEQSVIQWASAFAERALGVSKTFGDLAGPAIFSILMGLSRLLYGKYGDKIPLERVMCLSGALCVLSYLLTALSPSPVFGLSGIALCGLSVGIMWPGTFSGAAASIRGGGTAMFALLALGGDLGCMAGPSLAGAVASAAGDNLHLGILCAAVFPILLTLVMIFRQPKRGESAGSEE